MMDADHISRQFTLEISFVVLLLRVKMGIATVNDLHQYFEKNSPDIYNVLLLIKEHELGNLIFSSKMLRDFLFSKPKNNALLQNIELRARNNLLILAEMLQLNKKFKDKSISVVFYKGVLLSKLLFNDFTTRATSDIDILINSSDFLDIRRELLDSGYEEVYYYPKDYPEYFLSNSRESSFKKKFEGEQYLYIEIQWSTLPKFYGLPYDNDYFFENKIDFQIVDEHIPTPKLTQHLLILFIHHGISDLWRNLKHIYDISVFINRFNSEIDWIEFYKKSKDWQATENFNCGLRLVSLLFGVSPVQPISWNIHSYRSDKVLNSLLSFPLLRKDKKNIKNLSRQLLLCDSKKDRIYLFFGYLKLAIWPSMIDLKNTQFPPSLFPLYFITKRFRFLYKSK